MALAIGFAAAVAERHVPLSGLLADHATRTGERRSVTLPDGSRVVLNTRSAIDVEFDEQRRAVVRVARPQADHAVTNAFRGVSP